MVINRDPDTPPALVIPRFYYYYTVVDAGFTTNRPVYVYGDPGDPTRPFYPDRGEAGLDAVERDRSAHLDAALAGQASLDGLAKALAAALRDLGVAKGAVGYDVAAIPGWMDHQGVDLEWRQADDALRYIRLIKSPLEIALMRHASAVNLSAAHAMMAGAREGVSYRDLRRRFFTEAAARGGEGVSLTVDRISNELADRQLRDGQALMIDAVSRTNYYHGDYGRTLFLGEPLAPMRRGGGGDGGGLGGGARGGEARRALFGSGGDRVGRGAQGRLRLQDRLHPPQRRADAHRRAHALDRRPAGQGGTWCWRRA